MTSCWCPHLAWLQIEHAFAISQQNLSGTAALLVLCVMPWLSLQVDQEGFERELDSQKKRSREAYKGVDLTAGRALGDLAGQLGTSDFIGYEHGSLRAEASVLAILREGKTVDSASAGEEVEVVLDRTPFYAESGGQVLPMICCVSTVCFGQACPHLHAMPCERPGL